MRKYIFFFIFTTLLASEHVDIEKSKFISSFKQTLVNKGVKILDKIKKTKSYEPHELIVDLRNPSYKNGILITHDGGVIKGEDIRIQAKSIQYIKRYEKDKFVHRIEAEKDLIIQYKGRIYVGEELEYDFTTKTGVVYEGKTFAAFWYLGGDKIQLRSDGSYHVENVYITTCENVNSTWDIHAGRVNVFKKDLLEAKKVRFRFFKLPTFWLPSFKVNLKKFFGTPLIRYKVNWDKSSGPKGSLRYRLYSWHDFALWGRLECRIKKGWGGAIETEYEPAHKRTTFNTKNYLATDVIPKNLIKNHRYRIQGVFHNISPSKKTKIDMTWDKFSDINMPSDFKSDDFELNTAKKTEFSLRHEEDFLLTTLYTRPRVNNFDTIKENLPTGYLSIIPYKIPNMNFLFFNNFSMSYLDYQYSKKLKKSLNNLSSLQNPIKEGAVNYSNNPYVSPNFDSIRLESNQLLSKPFKNNFINLTPYVGFKGIIYSKSPNNSAKTQAMVLYGGNFNIDFYKNYLRHKHVIIPYVQYQGITKPLLKIDTYYIFSIEDGFDKLNLIKTGIKNQVYSLKKIRLYPTFETDIFANTFLDSNFIPKTLPKIYLDFKWHLPSLFFISNNAWNLDQYTLDFSNTRLGWTVNENLAMSLEFRYRSSFDFRKSNHQNFILDSSRNFDELVNSPISDKRNTFLTHIFFRLNPFWTCEIHSHHGWNRKKEPAYNEYRIDLYTMVSSAWQVKISYQRIQSDNRFSGSVNLINF